jgi:hypothetical protein
MKSNPNKPAVDFINQGEMILRSDHSASDGGKEWALVDTMRSLLHSRLSALKIKTRRLDEVNEKYGELNSDKKASLSEIAENIDKIRVYIENAYFYDASAILEELGVNIKPPKSEKALIEYMRNFLQQLDNNDDKLKIPDNFIGTLRDVHPKLDNMNTELSILRKERDKLIADRSAALDEFRDLLPAIRRWLWKMLPDGRSDHRLSNYGFKPYGQDSNTVCTKENDL